MRISKIVGNISYLTLKCEIQYRKNIDWFKFYLSQRMRNLVYIDDKIISDNIFIELPYQKETTKINYTKQYKNNNFNRNQLIGYTDEKVIKILKDTYLNNYINIDDIEIQYDSKILNHTVVKVPSVIKVYTKDDVTIIRRKLKIRKNELEN